ncbi:MAG: ATP-dependent zinc metalloprotease FtsH [Bacteroidales bacterium]|jgi:cell division protease FtsH|nr:ATP-dependent zinc metalloprotease FtsH [Bacteroidales bacterium]
MEQNKNKNKTQQNNPLGKKTGKKPIKSFYWIYAILALLFIGMWMFQWDEPSTKTTWKELKALLEGKQIDKIVVYNEKEAYIYVNSSSEEPPKTDFLSQGPKPKYIYTIGPAEKFADMVQKVQIEKGISESDQIYIEWESKSDWGTGIFSVLIWVLPIVLIWFIFSRMIRNSGGGAGGGGIFNMGKSKAQLIDKDTSVNVTFKDVAGQEEAKIEVMEIVDFLKNPQKYTALGGKIPKGALLVGPPGTGKTLLAKAVAGEAKVPFFSLSGSDFVEMFVGVGASRVRDLFYQAKEKAPCIIFIDEIDAIGRARGKNAFSGSNDERENTLNQLLTEMDGFGTNVGVIILAATNRADILDRALLRAGRFDRQIYLDLPDLDERRAIFEVHMKPLKTNKKDVNSEMLAKQTPGFSGADIANVCNEAALIAARKAKKNIEKQDFIDSIDRIVGGLEKKNKIITSDEKRVIAFHEAGHAAVSWMLPYAHPLVKVTIVPRGKSLGAAWYLPDERQITTKEQMLDEMTATLGGRASEEVNFGKISTGALNDLERVTRQAYSMVAYFGLNKRIGNLSYYDSTGQSEYTFQKPYSEKTAQVIDEEVSKMVESAYEVAVRIVKENKEKVETLAERLLEKEVIFREDLEEIFGLRNFEHEHKAQAEREEIMKKRQQVLNNFSDKKEQKLEQDNSDIEQE